MNLSMYLSIGDIFLAGILAGLYFIFLCYTIRRALNFISDFSSFAPIRILMLVTLLTAAITIIRFFIGQVADWALETGVYGMWNIYIFSLMLMLLRGLRAKQGADEMGLTHSEETEN